MRSMIYRRSNAMGHHVCSSAAIFALAGMLSGLAIAQSPPAQVRTDPATLQNVQEHRLVTGELRAVRRANVAGEEPSIVLEVPVSEGSLVKKGDVLARLDSRRLDLALVEAQAMQAVAEATLEERRAEAQWRQQDVDNLKRLSAGGAGNPKELYDAESALRIAQAKSIAAEREVAAMQARANLLERRVTDTTILAPFDGIVVVKHAEQGEWLAEGDPVVELVSSGMIEAWLDVPQQFADAVMGRSLSVGITVEATGATIESSELRVIPLVDPRARTFALVARLDNSKGLLAPGMSVVAQVPTGEVVEQLTIAKDAVLRNQVGAFAYVVRGGGAQQPATATPADVQVLFPLRDRFAVRSGQIQPGDLLVVEGNERLFPGAPVIPQTLDAVQAAVPGGDSTQRSN